MTGLLFIGGYAPERKTVEDRIGRADLIAAADSGFDTAYCMGVSPDIIVGDMDSIKRKNLLNRYPDDKLFLYDSEKDETDTEIGIRILSEMGVDRITLVGGGGGRLDHIYGIILLFEREIHPFEWITEKEMIFSIDNQINLTDMENRVISLFPIGESVCTMKSSGLKWPLDELKWRKGDMGISNLGISSDVSVEITSGRLLMIYNYLDGADTIS